MSGKGLPSCGQNQCTPYALPCGFYGVNIDSYKEGHVRQNDAFVSGTAGYSFNIEISMA